jgi:DNA-binding transcriptional LysR family regulator
VRYFVAVADELHFGRAADRPPRDPAVAEPGDPAPGGGAGRRLLDRSTRSVALTDAGRLLHEEGRRLLIDAGRLARDVQDIGRGGQREARLGFMLPGPGARAPDLLERFAAARPRDAVRLIPLDLPDRLRAVLDGEVDAALVLGPVRGAPGCWRSRRSPWSPAWCACAPITRSPRAPAR